MATRVQTDTSTNRLTLEQLKRIHPGAKRHLTKEIKPDDHLLARCFDGYDPYMGALGLLPCEKRDVRAVAREDGSQSAMTKALTFWYKRNPQAATYNALVRKVLQLEEGETATNICKYLKKKYEHELDIDSEDYTNIDERTRSNTSSSTGSEMLSLTSSINLMPEHSSYHGTIKGREAALRLMEFETRCYLTRYSRVRDCYVLSVYEPDKTIKPNVQHFKIIIKTVKFGGILGWFQSQKNVYQINEKEFESPEELLQYYEKNRIDPGFQDIGRCIAKQSYLEKIRK